MPQGAHVTSVEAVDEFRSNLIIYLSKARPTLEEVSEDARRTRIWLENDQRTRWESEVKRRAKQLEQAQQALFSSSISNLRDASDVQKMAVHRAKQALEEAEAKLKVVKQWAREFDSRVEPLSKQLDKLHTMLAHDMLKAVAHLANVLKALAAYAEVAPPDTSSGAPPATAEQAPAEGAPATVPAGPEGGPGGGHA
jgi:hypothetical protein